MANLRINGRDVAVDADPDTPLLWVIRDHVNLTGTKFGCGAGLCGACTVHLDGAAIRSCITPLVDAEGAEITTIEGLSSGRQPPCAAGVARRAGAAVRLLPAGHDHGRGRAARRRRRNRAMPTSTRP